MIYNKDFRKSSKILIKYTAKCLNQGLMIIMQMKWNKKMAAKMKNLNGKSY